jgi:K+-transporting ATPase KdpF subunit
MNAVACRQPQPGERIICQEYYFYAARDLVAGYVLAGSIIYGRVLSIHESVRKYLDRENKMIFVTGIIALLLFIYLFVALIRPEWF